MLYLYNDIHASVYTTSQNEDFSLNNVPTSLDMDNAVTGSIMQLTTLTSARERVLQLQLITNKMRAQHKPATTMVDNTRSCNYSDMFLIMGKNIVRNM
jgi:hypothetical protein